MKTPPDLPEDLPEDEELALTMDLVATEHRLLGLLRQVRGICEERALVFEPAAFLLAYDLGLTAALTAVELAEPRVVEELLATVRQSDVYARVIAALAEES